jgi:hypothetical protein
VSTPTVDDAPEMQYIQPLLSIIMAMATRQSQLIPENTALKQQIIVLKRKTKKARIKDSDRLFWILVRRLLKDWKCCLHIVKPQTVVRWHNRGPLEAMNLLVLRHQIREGFSLHVTIAQFGLGIWPS